ncbi:uracil-DNA glycosylase [Thermocladium modestius]|uniref:Type-5 uracil-DNA glycosylase n=1 Tax=Thermocladium modestius TaxID=62609 RepID=A0A830GY76_9CREN|nr:uracil-DNA glycosylase [Thermocladium modestius]GGP20698.1 uracil-DNA glycosylase [Thermocladium modestius]
MLPGLFDCRDCPRLVQYRESVKPLPRFAGETYWRRPVPPWGEPGGVMIVGLAPAAHGGNRTGRMFTGDRSAEFLFKALHAAGLSNNPFSVSRNDGTRLRCAYLTSAVKCAPPNNRPLPSEVRNCLRWLRIEVDEVRPKSIVVLGRLAAQAISSVMGIRIEFKHGSYVDAGNVRVFISYHPSPRNTNTGRLSMEELIDILRKAGRWAGCDSI